MTHFFRGKKVSESDYWFRFVIINLFVPLRLLIKPQVDTARMFHNAETITNDFWREGGVVAGQTFKDEEERKKRKLIKAHNKGFENLEHPLPSHDFIDTMMFLARELVMR